MSKIKFSELNYLSAGDVKPAAYFPIVQDGKNFVTSVSSVGGGGSYDDSALQAASGNWDSTYTTVGTNSASWSIGTAQSLQEVTDIGNTTTNLINVSAITTGDGFVAGERTSTIGGNALSATGSDSVAVAGAYNTASAPYSIVAGGYSNYIDPLGLNSALLGGINNQVNEHERSVILGGSGLSTDADDTVYVSNINIAKTDGFKLGSSATPGHVLTTDDSGSGTWQAATGGGTIGSASWVYNSNGYNDQIHGDIPNDWRNIPAKTTDQLLVIGTSCTSIGNSAFVGHNNTDGGLVIPDSVTSIGTFAFQSYAASGTIKGNLYLSKNLTRIELGTFQIAKFIGELNLPAGLTYIGNNGFSSGTYTGDLTIPPLVTEIGSYSFFGNASLGTKLTLPESLTTIGAGSFRNCSGITTIDCFTTKTALDVSDSLLGSGVTTIHARATDATWTAGSGQTIGGKTGITVIKDL